MLWTALNCLAGTTMRINWHKQQYTAQPVYDRLKTEYVHFDLAYPRVQRFMKAYKAKMRQTKVF